MGKFRSILVGRGAVKRMVRRAHTGPDRLFYSACI
jgi:hypothetical protein